MKTPIEGQTEHGVMAEKLYTQLAQQLTEHKAHLVECITKHFVKQLREPSKGLQPGTINQLHCERLVQQVQEIKVIRSDGRTVPEQEGKPELIVVYDYPDALYDWLKVNLRETLAGGSLIPPSREAATIKVLDGGRSPRQTVKDFARGR